MRGLLDLLGALTLAGGLLSALLVLMTNNLVPWIVPASYAIGGVVGSVLWFALASILRRLDALHEMVTQERPEQP